MNTSDLIIIGAGPGGYEAALQAARAGLTVTLIEAAHFGGTCLNAGCIPTKCLAHSAEVYQLAKQSAGIGVGCPEVSLNLQQAVAHKNAVIEQLRLGIATLMKTPGITCVTGKAHFVDAHTVAVDDAQYSAAHIIIATGSTTKRLPVEGANLECVITSDEILNLTAVPRRLCVIGGGVVGLEFAAIFNTFGAEVTVVEYCKEVLPNLDKDMAKRLRTALKKQGIAFFTESGVQRIETMPDGGARVVFAQKGNEATVEADLVLMAVGRAPNVTPLNLEAAGVDYTPKGIKVDDNMHTSVPHIFAIGDANGLCPLAHAATFQGHRAVNQILGKTDTIDLNLVPSAVYTSPQLACVGLREEDFTTEKPVVHKAFYRANGRALTMDAQEGYLKILTNADGRILGAHIMGDQASELIHEAAALMKLGATVDQLKDIIHAHPTLSELYLSAVKA